MYIFDDIYKLCATCGERNKIYMKKHFFLLVSILLMSCANRIDETKTNLTENNFKLKIGPLWYNNESEIDFVYGVNTTEPKKDFITEFHFNFGGKTLCDSKKIISTIDFRLNEKLILPDSINKLLSATTEIIQRVKNKANVDFVFKNPSPGILVFTIEKVNLKPNGITNKIFLNLNSECNQKLKLPINLVKYNVINIEKLYENYIISELSKQSEKELINKKVIFSFNETVKSGNYLIDYVDQNSMLILSYNKNSKEYLIHNPEKKLIKKIKRST